MKTAKLAYFLCWKSYVFFSSIQSIILAIWAHHQLDNIRARHLGTIPYLVKLLVRSEKNIEGPVLLMLILPLAFISCSFWGFPRKRSWGNSFRASTIIPGQRLRRRATVPRAPCALEISQPSGRHHRASMNEVSQRLPPYGAQNFQ